jgi:glyoxylase-like metal-dependent hydrolase (beta-lactamase superfamily II)
MSDLLQITPKVYQLSGAANIYLLKTSPEALTILDTGIPGNTKRILSAADYLGYESTAIRHILITHADFDHVGSLAGLVKATGAMVYAGEISKPYIETAQPPPHGPAAFRLVMGAMQSMMVQPTKVDEVVVDGDTLPLGGGIEVLSTPGHTAGSMSFYWRAESVLFIADLMMTQGGSLRPMPGMVTWDKEAVRKSTNKALALGPSYIAVGHGPAVNTATLAGEKAKLEMA